METTPIPLLARTTLWRRLFWLYFAVLTVFLLWPKLTVPAVVPRPDLIVHGLAFGLFALLLCLWNPTGTPRPFMNALSAFTLGAAYGGLTELLQSIPILKRSAAWDDWAADVFGVCCGLAAYTLARRLAKAR